MYIEEDKIFVKKLLQSGVVDLVFIYGKDVIFYELMQGELIMKKGLLIFVGNVMFKLNIKIQLVGFGKLYSGDVFIIIVQYEVREGNWQISVGFGLDNDIGISDLDVDLVNLGLLEVNGLQFGVVEKVEDDLDKEF